MYPWTILRTLTRMGYPKKSLMHREAERNEGFQTLCELEVAELDDMDYFVFVNESAVDNRTVQRSSEWLIVGAVQHLVLHTEIRKRRDLHLPQQW